MAEAVLSNENPEHASWIELSQEAFLNNINVYRSLIESQVLLGCVLKANAYGHGFMECLKILHDYIDIIFVINPQDAFKIRKYEKEKDLIQKRVIVLGAISPTEAALCARKVVEVVITDESWVHHIPVLKRSEKEHGNAYRTLKAHIHVDTGLAREGFHYSEVNHKLTFLKENKSLIHVQGVMSHFANTEDVTEQAYAFEQAQKFETASSQIIQTLGINYKLEKHIAQSASTLIMNTSHHDLVRIGIALYGFWPSTETKLSAKVVLHDLPVLKPVLSWKCKSQSIKRISAGSYIGYGCSSRAERDLLVALFPVGYFDGYPRLLSHQGHVLVNKMRCNILGRVMMNHILVDVTEATSDISQAVVATLIGKDGQECVTAENIANWSQTIHYEIVAHIGAHLKRMVVH